MRLWHWCSRTVCDPVFDDKRWPDCRADERSINGAICCSRYLHGAPPRSSSGLGRWKGGEMRSATSDGVAHLTRAVGDGLGDDVGIYTH